MNKKMGISLVLVFIIFYCFWFAGCTGKKNQNNGNAVSAVMTQKSLTPPPPGEEMRFKPTEREPLKVIVSTDIIREIMYVFANSRTKGRVLIANGTNPLAYVPTAQDKQEMQDAKLVLYIGLGLEPALESYLKTIKDKVRVVALSDAFEKSELIPSKAYRGGYDPHFWWNPKLWEKAILYTLKILDDYDPEFQYDYQSTFIRYGESLSHLNRYFESWLGMLPDNAVLFTLHPAFAYLGKAFNLETMSILQPGVLKLDNNRLTELTSYIIEHKVTTVFPEYQFPRDEIERVVSALKQQSYQLNMGEAIFSYNLGLAGEPEFTYLRAARKLVDTIYTQLKAEGAPDVPR